MRRKPLRYHLFHFALLLAVLLVGAISVLSLRHDPRLQQYAVAAMGASYVLWGAVHHYSEGDLHPRVLLEYILMAMLCVSILLSIMIRA
jgi:hypothetical protein